MPLSRPPAPKPRLPPAPVGSGEGALTCRVLGAMSEVSAAAWDALVPDDARPFLAWGFLDLLESSGAAVAAKGWTPRHLTLWQGEELVAAAPGYVKTHSMGELFYNDFRWSGVASRFGVDYYPKYVVTAPFSPAAGPKLLVRPGADGPGLRRRLARAALALARDEGCSSAAVLFASPGDLAALEAEGFAPGAGIQFHWENKAFSEFDGFLARFNAKRRHMVKAERAQLAKDGTVVRTLTGEALTPEVLAFASRCYEQTVAQHAWNAPHLTGAFFAGVVAAVPGAVEVVVAEDAGRRLACAFNLRGTRRLYGRHWGALEDRRYLHFNVCYYHSIERSIALGLEAFEPGAGGEHKLARGFEPTLMQSAHAFVEPRLHAAMAGHLAREVAAWRAEVARARAQELAFKSGTAG